MDYALLITTYTILIIVAIIMILAEIIDKLRGKRKWDVKIVMETKKKKRE